ncbi:hypothetical protein H5410_049251 [Solanum commersonii]|uniref:Uncharacterized protein n=1 Tax=Solanum commersonii TaxID=4109 RepID=A0A9J5XKL0_SOLCO|nr:hypothetical protein H5410_049251 [Solanum commersonii]
MELRKDLTITCNLRETKQSAKEGLRSNLIFKQEKMTNSKRHGKKTAFREKGGREDVKVDIETARVWVLQGGWAKFSGLQRDFRWDFVWRPVTFFARERRWYRGGGIVGMLLLLGIELNGFLG